jgi:hypothetical protein
MRMIQGWTGLRTMVTALGLLAWTTARVEAAEIPNLLEYSTAGAPIVTTGVSGTNVISFEGVQDAQIDPSSNLSLGSFQVSALPAGQTTTYDNTPFQISFNPISYGGTAISNSTPITISGTLNGQITGNYQSSVQVTINPITSGSSFQLAGASSTLSVLQNDQKLLVPYSSGGVTTLEGIINTSGVLNPEAPAPEPSTVALFLSALGGLGLRKYVLSRRRRS